MCKDLCLTEHLSKNDEWNFPGRAVVKTLHFNAGGGGLIPSQRTKDPTCLWCGQTKKEEKKKELVLDKCTILGTGDTVVSKRDAGSGLRELVI